VATIYTVDKKS